MIKMKTTGKIGKVNIVLGLLLVLGSMIAVCAAQDAIPEAIVFENTNMEGEHKHYFTSDPDLTEDSDGRFWDDKISSIVVISGNWSFFENPVGSGDMPNKSVTLGPGVYRDVTLERMEDNSISQVRLESES
jgi:Beta/Gamma crystallin